MVAAQPDAMATALSTAKRDVRLLATAQAFLGSIAPIAISTGGLAGYQLLAADKSLATAPVTGFNIGTALGAVLIALISSYLGLRGRFIFGTVLSMAGGVLAAIALLRADFWLFALGLLFLGLSAGFVQKIRFAAADLSPSFYKPKAISWILGGGIVSAVVGPQVVILAKDLLEPVTFAGSFLAIIPIALIGAIIMTLVHFKPHVDHADGQVIAPARPLSEIVANQRFITGMICGISSYALMSFLMTGAPLAMVVGCGYSSDIATLGIQWHVMAMFAPSFVTGQLISRFGVEKIVAAGIVILMGCAAMAAAGIAVWNFWGALVLLGVGWNFGFIGSTAIVSASYKPNEADKVQGFHDIILFTIVALSSFGAGKMFNAYGWFAMNLVVWPVAIVCLILLFALMRKNPVKVG
ncbi:MFS transporter [Rhizobium sp. L1K21]|uniref:MFS transporter n=1 Tax=Rhizobium sp. L1K21 TaxID=2954933 RepID=UPI00209298C8|nr:MFS transporter [Rhizobium sp. L1K21]MCO6185826.1 MFS transporter [Rhizobium sp. L1K21]